MSSQSSATSALACRLIRIFAIFIALPSYVHVLKSDVYESDFFIINMPEIAVFL